MVLVQDGDGLLNARRSSASTLYGLSFRPREENSGSVLLVLSDQPTLLEQLEEVCD